MRDAIVSFLGDDWPLMIEQIKESLQTDIHFLDSTNSQILGHSGKLLRPMLALLSARACSGFTSRDSLRYAAAVEILHNATLMHDDVADHSTERRGIPTLNASKGSGTAVLVGDFWLARAVLTVFGSEHFSQVMHLFARTLSELAEGEMLQMEKSLSADTTEADYFRIIDCKTAALFEASCVSAAISVDAPDEYKEAMRRYAIAAGEAFQVQDDILDYAGDAALGKPLGNDLREKKITLPLLCALDGSPRDAEIRSLVANMDDRAFETVNLFVAERNGVRLAQERLDRLIESAVEALSPLPDSQAKDYLAALVRLNTNRRV